MIVGVKTRDLILPLLALYPLLQFAFFAEWLKIAYMKENVEKICELEKEL